MDWFAQGNHAFEVALAREEARYFDYDFDADYDSDPDADPNNTDFVSEADYYATV